MRQSLAAVLLLAAALPAAAIAQHEHHAAVDPALSTAVAASTRTDANRARDKYRHPAETLAFFGVKPGDTVVEIWPGGGWYTEILAPYVGAQGTLYVANNTGRGSDAWAKRVAETPAYSRVKLATFPMAEGGTPVPAGSADVVLTFRNAHNWRQGYGRDGKDYSGQAFKELYDMLKPGGVLGVVDHRLPEDADAAREMNSGYIKTSTVKRLAEQAGFKFVAASEVNANPKDSADWPDGVWTLPPSLSKGDVDRTKYLAIGESDRMTLKFVKPAN